MDKVGDLLIRIKNGYMASKRQVNVSYSKLNLAILELLKKEGYVVEFKEEVEKWQILVSLRYDGKRPALTDVKRISKPGRRVYTGTKFLPTVIDGRGMAIISTPKGIMTDKAARKEKVGGEIMAYVW